jgi:hypothetical protein
VSVCVCVCVGTTVCACGGEGIDSIHPSIHMHTYRGGQSRVGPRLCQALQHMLVPRARRLVQRRPPKPVCVWVEGGVRVGWIVKGNGMCATGGGLRMRMGMDSATTAACVKAAGAAKGSHLDLIEPKQANRTSKSSRAPLFNLPSYPTPNHPTKTPRPPSPFPQQKKKKKNTHRFRASSSTPGTDTIQSTMRYAPQLAAKIRGVFPSPSTAWLRNPPAPPSQWWPSRCASLIKAGKSCRRTSSGRGGGGGKRRLRRPIFFFFFFFSRLLLRQGCFVVLLLGAAAGCRILRCVYGSRAAVVVAYGAVRLQPFPPKQPRPTTYTLLLLLLPPPPRPATGVRRSIQAAAD